MSRPRAALALLGVLGYFFAGSYVCALVFTRFGAAAYWGALVPYAAVGTSLVVVYTRAVWS